ncbi:MAG: tetratricopeptide repeat protein [Candidatus Hydrogenedens sp.]
MDIKYENIIKQKTEQTTNMSFPPLLRQTITMACILLIAVLIVSVAYQIYCPSILQRLDDNVGENLMKFAQALEQNKNTEDAKRIYERATHSRFAGEFNRTYIYYRLGYLCWADQEFEKSAEYLRQAVQSEEYPQINAYELLIDSLLRLGKHTEALPFTEQWLKKVQKREDLANAHYYLGRIYQLSNDMPMAEEIWIKGHKILPGSKSSFELAFLYKKQGDCKKAVYYAESVLKAGLLPTREPAIKKLISQCNSAK